MGSPVHEKYKIDDMALCHKSWGGVNDAFVFREVFSYFFSLSITQLIKKFAERWEEYIVFGVRKAALFLDVAVQINYPSL